PFDGATSVDDPEGSCALQLSDQLNAGGIQDRFVLMRNESAIEVCTDKMNPATHNYNIEIDFANATSNGLHDEICLRTRDGAAAKRLAQCGAYSGAKGPAGRGRFVFQCQNRRAENLPVRPNQKGCCFRKIR